MFGQQLRTIRQQKELTQVQLSALAHIDQSDLSKIERDQRGISLKAAIAIADALDIRLDYIAGRTKNPEINK